MPTVAVNRIEPQHIYVKFETRTAKFWLNRVRLEKSKNFNDRELREIQKIVEENGIFQIHIKVVDTFFISSFSHLLRMPTLAFWVNSSNMIPKAAFGGFGNTAK